MYTNALMQLTTNSALRTCVIRRECASTITSQDAVCSLAARGGEGEEIGGEEKERR